MNPQQLLQHFDRISEAPDAIPRLRRFILDLAVRGKLVEQDPNDEPASELLKRIQSQKAELSDSVRRRNVGKTSTPSNSAIPYSSPQNWVWVSFGDIMISRDGERIPVSKEERNNRPKIYDYYGASGVIDKIDAYLFDKPLLLIGEDGANLINRSTPIAFIARGKYWVNNHAHVLDSISEGFLQFIELHINAIDLKPFVTGTAQPKMNQAKMNSIPIALPPLAEQHRIVAKVDELMALCDQLQAAQTEREQHRDRLVAASLHRLNPAAADAEANTPNAQRENARFLFNHLPRLTTRPEHIKQLRQTILNLAVRGKLVPQDPNDEPASELLKRIYAEKSHQRLNIHNKKAKTSLTLFDSVPAAPLGWQWISFSDYAFEISTGPFGSALHKSDYVLDGIPLVNPSHMERGRIKSDRKVTVSEDTANRLASYRMKAGDIVMARRGEVGRAALVTEKEHGWLCGTGSFFIRFHKEVFREYVLLLFQSLFVRKFLVGEAVGITMGNLNHGILKRMPLAIPPLAEQHRIVAKVDELMALCDQLETQLADTTADSRRLLEAVLHQALLPAGQAASAAN